MAYLTPEEAAFRDALPPTLGLGERDSLAVAKHRGGVILSNESRVAHYGRQYEVPCLRLPDILRALWVEGSLAKEEVQAIVHDLQVQDRMQFKPAVLDGIFAD